MDTESCLLNVISLLPGSLNSSVHWDSEYERSSPS
jgi:hypothetical protein